MRKLSIMQTGTIVKNTGVYFKLENDKDNAIITILDKVEDMELHLIHEFKEKKTDRNGRTVKCLATINEDGTIDHTSCPLCENKEKLSEKVYLHIYNHNEKCKQVWSLQKAVVEKILLLIEKGVDLSKALLDVTRLGKANNKKTSYDISVVGSQELSKEELELETPEFNKTVYFELDSKEMLEIIIDRKSDLFERIIETRKEDN
ncbi:MAG: hypothetical protein ACRCTZ_15065 [Sarcina sp.]